MLCGIFVNFKLNQSRISFWPANKLKNCPAKIESHYRKMSVLHPANSSSSSAYPKCLFSTADTQNRKVWLAIIEWEDGSRTHGAHSEKDYSLIHGTRIDGRTGQVHALRKQRGVNILLLECKNKKGDKIKAFKYAEKVENFAAKKSISIAVCPTISSETIYLGVHQTRSSSIIGRLSTPNGNLCGPEMVHGKALLDEPKRYEYQYRDKKKT